MKIQCQPSRSQRRGSRNKVDDNTDPGRTQEQFPSRSQQVSATHKHSTLQDSVLFSSSLYETCDGTVSQLHQFLAEINRPDAINIIDKALEKSEVSLAEGEGTSSHGKECTW